MVTGRVVPLAASLFGWSRGAQGSELLVVQGSHAPGRGSHGAAGRRVRQRLHLSRPRTRRRQWLAAGRCRPRGALDGKGTMKPVGVLALAALIVAVSAASNAAAARPCKADPRVVGECFRVHGRLSFYNGNPSFRIWWVGTPRILGVNDDEDPIAPDKIAGHLSTDKDIFGDFVVCPLTVERAGWMRRVCVESAEHLVVRARR